jgi:hypothetical protein
MTTDRTEELVRFDRAVRIAMDGTGRTRAQAELWAKDYLVVVEYTTQDAAVESANIKEAERTVKIAKDESDMQHCIIARQNLYFETEEQATRSCKANISQLSDLYSLEVNLAVKTSITESIGFKDGLGNHYTHEEAEAMARKELGLPKSKAVTANDAVQMPDLYGKTPEELKKLAIADSKKTGFPNLYGKSKEEIDEELRRL